MSVKFFKGHKLYSKRKYYTILTGVWLYTLIYIGVIVLYFYYYNEMSIVANVLILFFLILGGSGITKELFYSYNKYKQRWEEDNKPGEANEKSKVEPFSW